LSCENDNFEIHIVLSCADRRPPNLQQTPPNLQRALRNKYVCNFLKPKLGDDLVRKIDTLVWELEQIDSLVWELEQIDSLVWELKQQLPENVEEEGSDAEEEGSGAEERPPPQHFWPA
jgi:hypothetical protein